MNKKDKERKRKKYLIRLLEYLLIHDDQKLSSKKYHLLRKIFHKPWKRLHSMSIPYKKIDYPHWSGKPTHNVHKAHKIKILNIPKSSSTKSCHILTEAKKYLKKKKKKYLSSHSSSYNKKKLSRTPGKLKHKLSSVKKPSLRDHLTNLIIEKKKNEDTFPDKLSNAKDTAGFILNAGLQFHEKNEPVIEDIMDNIDNDDIKKKIRQIYDKKNDEFIDGLENKIIKNIDTPQIQKQGTVIKKMINEIRNFENEKTKELYNELNTDEEIKKIIDKIQESSESPDYSRGGRLVGDVYTTPYVSEKKTPGKVETTFPHTTPVTKRELGSPKRTTKSRKLNKSKTLPDTIRKLKRHLIYE